MSYEPPYGDVPPPYDFKPASQAAARERVLFPAIFLIVVAVLNLFMAVVLALLGAAYKSLPTEQVDRLLAQRNAEQWDEMQRRGYTARSMLDLAARVLFTWSGFTGLAGILILFGGVRMIQLRSY